MRVKRVEQNAAGYLLWQTMKSLCNKNTDQESHNFRWVKTPDNDPVCGSTVHYCISVRRKYRSPTDVHL